MASTTTGSGCALVTVLDWEGLPKRLVRCPIPAGARPGGAVVYLGDRNDFSRVALPNVPIRVGGGTGDDTLYWADGEMSGGPGNDVLNGSGRLDGGSGEDQVEGSGRLDGGPGSDRVVGDGVCDISGT